MTITFPKPSMPRPSILKPGFIKPGIPGILIAGALVAQYFLFGPGSSPEPHCQLDFERIHTSTFLEERHSKSAIKLNISSTCNAPQKRTTLIAALERQIGSEYVVVKRFNETVAEPKDASRMKAKIKDLFVECKPSGNIKYRGIASGTVLLANGRVIPIKGDSQNPDDVPCEVKAQ